MVDIVKGDINNDYVASDYNSEDYATIPTIVITETTQAVMGTAKKVDETLVITEQTNSLKTKTRIPPTDAINITETTVAHIEHDVVTPPTGGGIPLSQRIRKKPQQPRYRSIAQQIIQPFLELIKPTDKEEEEDKKKIREEELRFPVSSTIKIKYNIESAEAYQFKKEISDSLAAITTKTELESLTTPQIKYTEQEADSQTYTHTSQQASDKTIRPEITQVESEISTEIYKDNNNIPTEKQQQPTPVTSTCRFNYNILNPVENAILTAKIGDILNTVTSSPLKIRYDIRNTVLSQPLTAKYNIKDYKLYTKVLKYASLFRELDTLDSFEQYEEEEEEQQGVELVV